jgi:hypothetical protein
LQLDRIGLCEVERVVAAPAAAEASHRDRPPLSIRGARRAAVRGIDEEVLDDRRGVDAEAVSEPGLPRDGLEHGAGNVGEELASGAAVEPLPFARSSSHREPAGLEAVELSVVGADQQHPAAVALALEEAAVAAVPARRQVTGAAVTFEVAGQIDRVAGTGHQQWLGVEDVAEDELDLLSGRGVARRSYRERLAEDGLGLPARPVDLQRIAGIEAEPEAPRQIDRHRVRGERVVELAERARNAIDAVR